MQIWAYAEICAYVVNVFALCAYELNSRLCIAKNYILCACALMQIKLCDWVSKCSCANMNAYTSIN